MPDEIRMCVDCGQMFKWTEKDQKDHVEDEATGDLLEGLDPTVRCKGCRGKQDQQRS